MNAGAASMGAAAPGEPVRYITDARYERLLAMLDDARMRNIAGETAAGDDVPRLLFHEARMLDERRYDDWLALFAPECIYWVPRSNTPGDPRTETAIYLDDGRRLHDRVAAIRTGFFHAQNPPSRTRRMLANVEQWSAADGSLRARANVVIWEHRKGETRAHPGWQAYDIVRDAQGTLAIATKVVCLLDCDAPQGNYAFIL